ncbi:MAG: CHASE3 domain-containing protein, partial [Terracidiphilus sp.]
MTIGKKLYMGFGAILAIMLGLLVINIFTVMRQYSARAEVTATLNDVQAIQNVQYSISENRLNLANYLLSGDLRDEQKTNKGISDLDQLLKDSETKVTDQNLRSALSQVQD